MGGALLLISALVAASSPGISAAGGRVFFYVQLWLIGTTTKLLNSSEKLRFAACTQVMPMTLALSK